MSRIHVIREHRIGLAAARAEIDRIAQRVQEEFGAHYDWDGDTLNFARPGVSGHITVTDDAIDLFIQLGLLLTPMRHHIEERIVGKIDRALARYHAACDDRTDA